MVYTDPEKYLEERFQIVHEIVFFTMKRFDSHEDLGPNLAECTRRSITASPSSEINIDKETILLILYKHDITNRCVIIKDYSIEQGFMP